MSTEHRESDLIRSWLDESYEAEADPQNYLEHLLDKVPDTPQQERPWWPFPLFRREAQTHTPATTDTTEYQPNPIPASNGHTPTVIGRTQSMLSPAKAITAGALIFAIGGTFLIAQPFQQQSSVPGAETEAGTAESTPFTMSFVWLDQAVESGEEMTEGGVSKTIGDCYAMGVAAPSDPRLDGTVTYCGGEHVYGEFKDESTNVWTATYRIVNDEGAWQGSLTGVVWDDPDSGERMDEGGDFVILAGEGAYDGLYAAVSLPWSDVHGVIFEGAPPAGPILLAAE